MKVQITSSSVINTTKKYAQKLILPATFATSLTACVGVYENNKNIEQVTMHQQVGADTFETDQKVKRIEPKEFNKEEKIFQRAIFQALPYINDGKFKKVEAMKNGIILDGEYKLHKKGENYYEGSYSLFDDHSFKIDKLKNGNFNLIYKNDDKIEALAFSKDGKLLSKFEAFKQNLPELPYKQPFAPKGTFEKLKPLPENTDDKIVKFNNPLSDKELNVIKNIIAAPMASIKIVDAKQDGNDIIFKYNFIYGDNFPEGEYTIKARNTVGLNYKRESNSDSTFEELNIHALDNGGYACCISNMAFWGSDYDVKYLDKDLNMQDEDWYRQDKALSEKIKKELSVAQMEEALENIKNGKPAQYKLDDKYLILLPKPEEKVVGETSLGTRTTTSCENVRNAIKNLPPEMRAMIVTTTVAVGGIMVEAVMIPTAPMIALGIEGVVFSQLGE